MLSLLFLVAAHAGEIRVETYEPVLIQIDAKVREIDEDTHAAWAHDLRPGEHVVRILDSRGRVVLEKELEVGAHDRVRLGYIDEALVVTRLEVFDDGRRPRHPVHDRELAVAHPHDGVHDRPHDAHDEAPADAPPLPPAPPAPEPMPEETFAALVSMVADASFPSEKKDLVRTAVAHNHFTIAQLGALLDGFAHSSDRIEVAELVAPKVLDPGNAFLLESHLTFSSEKEKILALFR